MHFLLLDQVLEGSDLVLELGMSLLDVPDQIVIGEELQLPFIGLDLFVVLDLHVECHALLLGLHDVIIGFLEAEVPAAVQHFHQLLVKLVAQRHIQINALSALEIDDFREQVVSRSAPWLRDLKQFHLRRRWDGPVQRIEYHGLA